VKSCYRKVRIPVWGVSVQDNQLVRTSKYFGIPPNRWSIVLVTVSIHLQYCGTVSIALNALSTPLDTWSIPINSNMNIISIALLVQHQIYYKIFIDWHTTHCWIQYLCILTYHLTP